MNPNLSLLSGNIEALLNPNMKVPYANQTSPSTGSPANDQLLQLILQQHQQNNLFTNANAANMLPQGNYSSLQQQLQAMSPQQPLQAQSFPQQQAATGSIGQPQQVPLYAGQQQPPQGHAQHEQQSAGTGAGEVPSQTTAVHHEERKQSAGSTPPLVDEQEAKQGQSSGVVPSKDEPSSSKPAHKTKKIKNSKVVEYTGSAKKGGQEQQHKIQEYGQASGYQQQNASIQVLSQSPLADQARV